MEKFQERIHGWSPQGKTLVSFITWMCTCGRGAVLWNADTSHWLRAITGRWKLPSTSECLYFPAKGHPPKWVTGVLLKPVQRFQRYLSRIEIIHSITFVPFLVKHHQLLSLVFWHHIVNISVASLLSF